MLDHLVVTEGRHFSFQEAEFYDYRNDLVELGGVMNLDFITPMAPHDKLHPNYVAMSKNKDDNGLEVFTKWAEGFPDRDGKLVYEFQTTFNSVFWEVYLHRLFLELGFQHDYTHNAPDYYLSKRGQQILVEATIASHSQDSTPEWDSVAKLTLPTSDFTQMNFDAMLRHLNSIHAKHKKYVTSYSKKDHVNGKPFVIALAPFDRPHFWLEVDRPIRAVLYDYYVDEKGDVDAPIIHKSGVPAKAIGSIQNRNGAVLDLGLFCNDKMKEVSAVIFSCIATVSKIRAIAPPSNSQLLFDCVRYNNDCIPIKYTVPHQMHRELLQDGLCVYHNPFATHPVDTGLFRFPGVQQHYYSQDDSAMVIEGYEGFLINRNCQVYHFVER